MYLFLNGGYILHLEKLVPVTKVTQANGEWSACSSSQNTLPISSCAVNSGRLLLVHNYLI